MDSVQRWMDATGMRIPLPPTDPSSWTCLLRALGPRRCLAELGPGQDAAGEELLRRLLTLMGRPVRDGESGPLLLVTPIPDTNVDEALFGLLGDGAYWVRMSACCLISMGTHPRAAAALVRSLGDIDNDVRRAAALGLRRLASPEALDALLLRPWDEDVSVDAARLEAVAAIAQQHGWSVVADRMAGVPEGAAAELLQAALHARHGGPADLLEAMGEGEPVLQRAVGHLLAACPAAAARAVERVAELVREVPGVDEQRGAVSALVAAGEDGVEAAADLLGADAWQVRMCGAMVLAGLGEAAARADAVLVQALDDVDPDVQREAAFARLVAGRDPEGMRERILGNLKRHEGFLERVLELGVSLGPLDAVLRGEPASLALLGLVRRLGDERLLGVATQWLGLSHPKCGPTLHAWARDEQRRIPLVQRQAAAAAGLWADQGSRGPGVVHRLLLTTSPGPSDVLRGRAGEVVAVAAHDGDWLVRLAALRTLRALGPEADPYRPMIDWLGANDPESEVRQEALAFSDPVWGEDTVAAAVADVLMPAPFTEGGGGPALMALARRDAEVAAEVSEGLLQHEDRPVALAAATVIGVAATGEEAAQVCRRGLRMLGSEAWTEREVGATLLASLVPAELPAALREEAAEAVAVAARNDHDADVQAAAAKACITLEAS